MKLIIINMDVECFTRLSLEGLEVNCYVNQKIDMVTEIKCSYVKDSIINGRKYIHFVSGNKDYWLTPKDYEDYVFV